MRTHLDPATFDTYAFLSMFNEKVHYVPNKLEGFHVSKF